MATHVTHKYNLQVFWNDEYKRLDYIHEPFNDPESVNQWISQGYQSKIVGAMADMRGRQPTWNNKFIEHFSALGWQDIGTSYYRMSTGTVMPNHSDLYKKYVELFNLQGREHTIRRAIVLLEDWHSGHYLEVNGVPIVNWQAGQVVERNYDAPHMAANIGLQDRYTLQLTGHIND
jgi:hypothetical protein